MRKKKKKKQTYKTITLELGLDRYDYVKRVAEYANTSMRTVIMVMLASRLMKEEKAILTGER